jgi:hypothetical protein
VVKSKQLLRLFLASLFLISCGNSAPNSAQAGLGNIPEKYKKFFETCPGIPSVEEKMEGGRAIAVGYCEHSDQKFVQFTTDIPESTNKPLTPTSTEKVEVSDNQNNSEAKNNQEDKVKKQDSSKELKTSGTSTNYVLETVRQGTAGHPFYLSPRNFPSVGQSFALATPVELKSIGVAINDRVTLLTPEGVESFRKDPTGMSLSQAQASSVEKAVFDPNYEFPAKVEVKVYKHKNGPIPSNFDIRNPNFELIFDEAKKSTINLESIYKTKINETLKLDAGYYLAVWRITETPENILSIFLSGRPERLDGSNNAYPYGRTYSANTESENSFNEHPTKSGEVDSSGNDIWCRGDLQIFVEGVKLNNEEIKLEKISDLPRGNPPDLQNCWSGGKRP